MLQNLTITTITTITTTIDFKQCHRENKIPLFTNSGILICYFRTSVKEFNVPLHGSNLTSKYYEHQGERKHCMD